MELTGTVINGRYKLDAPLGAGGMGSVWRGTDLLMNAPVAVKITSTDRPQAYERFQREARIGNLLGRSNDGFVRATDLGRLAVEGDYHFLVLDLVEDAGPLDLGLDRTLDQRLEAMEAAARLVARVHGLQVVHRDLKPENFLQTRDGKLYLTDFGLAKQLGDDERGDQVTALTSDGVAAGTLPYMAPEQFDDFRGADARADVFALGAMLFHGLTGKFPYPGQFQEVVLAHAAVRRGTQPPPRPSDHASDVPPALDLLCGQALELERGLRLEDAGRFLQGLQAARAALRPAIAETPAPQPVADVGGVEVVLDFAPAVSLASLLAGDPIVRGGIVRNATYGPLRDPVLRFELQDTGAKVIDVALSTLFPNEEEEFGGASERSLATWLAGLAESCSLHLRWNLVVGTQTVAAGERELLALPPDHVPLEAPHQTYALFVTPRHRCVVEIAQRVRASLAVAAGRRDVPTGYQDRSTRRVRAVLAALLAVIGAERVRRDEQKTGTRRIRSADRILRELMATPLELGLLHASVLEALGLAPLLVLDGDEVHVGTWLQEDTLGLGSGVVSDPALLRTSLALRPPVLAFYDPWVEVSFDGATRSAHGAIEDEDREEETPLEALDIRVLRTGHRLASLELPAGEWPALAVPDDGALESVRQLLQELREVGRSESGRLQRDDHPRFRVWQDRLLDLTLKNRLLKLPARGRNTLPIEVPNLFEFEDKLFQGQTFDIAPRPEDAAPMTSAKSAEVARSRLADMARGVIHTSVGAAELESRARHLRLEAKSSLEDGGAITLFIGIGFLRWFDGDADDDADALVAPLVLYPATIEFDRRNRTNRFRHMAGEEALGNVTLREKLRRDHRVDLSILDDLPQDEHGVDVKAVLNGVRAAIQRLPRWEVVDQACLGLFAFTRFLMWRDLRDHRSELLESSVVNRIATLFQAGPADTGEPAPQAHEGEPASEPVAAVATADLDADPDATALPLVVDADASQTAAVLAALRGKSFVLQGPPGTGKSQTITNIIAAALGRGLKVLFVSEKMAALDVVQRRLEQVGLADFCLELHSHSANKKAVVEALVRTLDRAERSAGVPWETRCKRLAEQRTALNDYVAALHRPQPCGLSFFQAKGQLIALRDAPDLRRRARPAAPGDESLATKAPSFDVATLERLRDVIRGYVQRAGSVGRLEDNPFRTLGLRSWSERLQRELGEVAEDTIEALDLLESAVRPLLELTARSTVWSTVALARLAQLAAAIAKGPFPVELVEDATAGELDAAIRRHQALVQDHGRRCGALAEGCAKVRGAASLAAEAKRATWSDAHVQQATSIAPHLAALAKVESAARPLAELTTASSWSTAELERLATLAERASRGPLPVKLVDQTTGPELEQRIRQHVAAVERHAAARLELLVTWKEPALSADLGEELRLLERWADSMAPMRWLMLRAVRQRLLALLVSDLPDDGARREAVRAAVSYVTDDRQLATDRRTLAHELERCWTEDQPHQALTRLAERVAGVRGAIEPFGADAVEPLLAAAAPPEESAARQSIAGQARELRAALEELGIRERAFLDATGTSRAAWFASEDPHGRQGARIALEGWGRLLDTLKGLSGELPGLQSSAHTLSRRLEGHWAAAATPSALEELRVRAAAVLAARRALTGTDVGPLVSMGAPLDAGPARTRLSDLAKVTSERLRGLKTAEEQLRRKGEIGAAHPINPDDPAHRTSLRTLAEHCRAPGTRLREWCFYLEALDRMVEARLDFLCEAVRAGTCELDRVADAFERWWLTHWVEAARDRDPALRKFSGRHHHGLVESFARDDAAHILLARQYVVASLEARLPPPQRATLDSSEVSILRHEAQKRSRHMSVRQLLKSMRTLLPRLKPCLLMSPLSVAQFLPADGTKFDLVVFDEASQIATHEAIGAMARGRQVVIVGDSKQLPPTTFFSRSDEEDDDGGEESEVPHDQESVLDEALGVNLPTQTLDWHYRSRHESLIAFSNRHYYKDRLTIFPSARAAEEIGIRWCAVPNGVYRSGRGKGGRTNEPEARALVEHLVAALRRTPPGQRSFGVVTFNKPQQELVEALLDERRGRTPEIEGHFDPGLNEPVFVKNLENVQGDERDEILFSITYARDANGRMRMSFGPLSIKGGERRLNVAVTRARQQLHVFSTLTPEQIVLGQGRAEGTRHLRAFLEYAARNGGAQPLAGVPGDGIDDEFTRDVHAGLAALGYEARPWVGCGHYRIDLGVISRTRRDEYLMGIELDGPSYRTAATARDRDRLRREVLQGRPATPTDRGLGWRLHRIWSLDWSDDRAAEIERLKAALSEAEADADRPRPVSPPPPPPTSKAVAGPKPAVDDEPDADEDGAAATGVLVPDAPPSTTARAGGESGRLSRAPTQAPPPVAIPYKTAPKRVISTEKDDVFETRAEAHFVERLKEVLEHEAPIHCDLLATKVMSAWSWQRLRQRARERFDLLLQRAETKGLVQLRGPFAWRPGQRVEHYRLADEEGAIRSIDYVPPEEAAVAAAWLLDQNLSLESGELVRETARLLGYERVRGQVEAAVRVALDILVRSGRARIAGSRVEKP